jgi:hypothetical protein
VELESAPTRDARLAVLRARREQILEQCDIVVAECNDPWIADEQGLTMRALSAFSAGHSEAAMALAVSIGEPLATWASTPRVKTFLSAADKDNWERKRKEIRKYRWVADELNGFPVSVDKDNVLRSAVIAPIVAFFKPFHVEKGDSIPDALSRHVVAHCATLSHYSLENALIALMLITSLLREMQGWCEEVRFMDGPNE